MAHGSSHHRSGASSTRGIRLPPRDDTTLLEASAATPCCVIRDGQLIYERYAGPTNAQTPHLTWSISKA